MKSRLKDSVIVAQCTPQGAGALALVRVVGIDCVTLVDTYAELKSKKKLHTQSTHTIHYGDFVDGMGECVDQVLFFVMKQPNSFTGLDTVEISCHNSPFIVNTILDTLVKAGARLAQPGEFTKLAVLHEKIDLVQAEAIDELIHATSGQQVKCALKQLKGSFSSWIGLIEERLIRALAFTAASFEFIEEENREFALYIKEDVEALLADIASIEKAFDTQVHLRQGFRIALIGSVNAGKSSLFNVMLGTQRAIVNPLAGTTRDVIEAAVCREGYFWTLIDTAGLRVTADQIEQEGIDRSFIEAASADVVLLVFDASRLPSLYEQELYAELYSKYKQKTIVVYNKVDQQVAQTFITDALFCSAHTKEGVGDLFAAITQKINFLLGTYNLPFLVNKRHLLLLQGTKRGLESVLMLCKQKSVPYELVSFELHDILVQLSELSGKTVSQEVLDRVFTTFCVGK